MVPLLTLSRINVSLTFFSVNIFLNDSVEPQYIGAVNGLGMMISSIFRWVLYSICSLHVNYLWNLVFNCLFRFKPKVSNFLLPCAKISLVGKHKSPIMSAIPVNMRKLKSICKHFNDVCTFCIDTAGKAKIQEKKAKMRRINFLNN